MRTTKRELERQLTQMGAALFEAEAQLKQMEVELFEAESQLKQTEIALLGAEIQIEHLSMRPASPPPPPPPLVDDYKIRCSIAREEAMRTGRTVRVM